MVYFKSSLNEKDFDSSEYYVTTQSKPTSNFPVWLLILIIVVIVMIALFFLLRLRKREEYKQKFGFRFY